MNNLLEKIKSTYLTRRFLISIGCIVAMFIISWLYFYPDVVEGNVLQQFDMRQGMANGHEIQQYAQATGQTSYWTNSLFGGMPTFQIAPSYSSNSLFSWINTLMGAGLPSPANLLFMMMLGFFILLMAMRLRWYVALIGAVAYGFSSYFIILIGAGHLWKFITLAYVPPTIAGMILAYRGRYLAGAALTALFGMMQISSNHVQMTYYFLFVVAGLMIAYAIVAWRKKAMPGWLKATGALAVAGILAVAANLPNLYNTYQYSKETMRGGHSQLSQASADPSQASSGGLNRDYIMQYSYGGVENLTLLIPNIKGGATVKPVDGHLALASLDQLPKAQEGDYSQQDMYILSQLPQYFGEPEPTNGPVYVGALIVVFFLIGCVVVKGPMKWALLLLTILSILLALGRNLPWLTNLMIDYMPLYSKFRTPESILVIAEFTMPLLGAIALNKLLSGDRKEMWQKYRNTLLWCFGAVLLICLVGIICPRLFGNPVTDAEIEMGLNSYPSAYQAVSDLRLDMVAADSMRSFMIVGAGLAVLWLYFSGLMSVAVVAVGIGVLVLGDLFLVNKRYLNHDSFTPQMESSAEDMFPLSTADEVILADTAMNYRVLDYTAFTGADPSYHHKHIGGYHAAKLTRYQDMIDYYLSGSHDNSNMLDMLNTRYLITDRNAMPHLNPFAMGNAWLVDKIDYVDTPDREIAAVESLNLETTAVAHKDFASVLGKSSPKEPGDTIFETSYAPNRLSYHVSSRQGGVAVFSEVYFPWGWQATIDGKPAELGRVNYILRALKVPAGNHAIEMVFDPQSIKVTTRAASVAVIIIYLLAIAAIVLPLLWKKPEDAAEL